MVVYVPLRRGVIRIDSEAPPLRVAQVVRMFGVFKGPEKFHSFFESKFSLLPSLLSLVQLRSRVLYVSTRTLSWRNILIRGQLRRFPRWVVAPGVHGLIPWVGRRRSRSYSQRLFSHNFPQHLLVFLNFLHIRLLSWEFTLARPYEMRRVHNGQIRGPRNVHKPLNLFLIFLELIVDGLFNLNLKWVYNTLNPLIPYHGPHPNQLILL